MVTLSLCPLAPERGKRLAVDVFFRTLADTHGAHAAAIVLSGADGDGAIGLKRIKERGGLTVAQDPDEAEHEGMPRSAITTGMVDWVLRAREVPPRLLEYFARGKRVQLPAENGPEPTKDVPVNPDVHEANLREVLGEPFIATYAAIKRAEFETFMEVISPWEREFLLLNV